jgi:hypothetical protein
MAQRCTSYHKQKASVHPWQGTCMVHEQASELTSDPVLALVSLPPPRRDDASWMRRYDPGLPVAADNASHPCAGTLSSGGSSTS